MGRGRAEETGSPCRPTREVSCGQERSAMWASGGETSLNRVAAPVEPFPVDDVIAVPQARRTPHPRNPRAEPVK